MLMGCDSKFNVHYGGGGGKSPPPLALQVGGKSPWGEKSPPIWHCEGGEKSPPGKISLPLKNIFTKIAWTFFACTAHEFDFNSTLLHSYILNLERSQTSRNMFLTLKIEKISKKLRSKRVKNYVFLFFFFLFFFFSFEIINSTGKLHKDFRTLFVFKHRRKTKKFTLKWQIPLFEKRVSLLLPGVQYPGPINMGQTPCNWFNRIYTHEKAHKLVEMFWKCLIIEILISIEARKLGTKPGCWVGKGRFRNLL